MIKEMSKVRIMGPKGLLDDAIRALHAMAVVHIEATSPLDSKGGGFLRKLPIEKEKVERRDALLKDIERLTNLQMLLTKPTGVSAPVPEVALNMLGDAYKAEEKVKALHLELDTLTEELSSTKRYEKILRGFASLVSRLGGLKNVEIIGLTLDASRRQVLRLIKAELERITESTFEIYTKDLDKDTIGMVLTYPKRYDRSVRHLISGEDINEIRLPSEYDDMPIIEAIKEMTVRKEHLPGLIDEVSSELKSVSLVWYPTVEGLIKAAKDALDEIGALAYCSHTRFAFMIEGWTPKETVEGLTEKFASMFGKKIVVIEVEIRSEEENLIPVYIQNPSFVRPFEVFMHALPTPKYKSIDPTPFVALFFPIFFGLIVGDIAYGMILFCLGLVLRWRAKGRQILLDAGYIVIVASLFAIIFGVLFGEFLGDLAEKHGVLHPILFDRVHAVKTFLVLTLGIGIGHVLLGLVVGVVNQVSRGRKKEALAKLSMVVLVVCFLVIAAIMTEYLPRGLLTPGLSVAIAAFVILTVIEGIIGPLEAIKALGNIVSYMRIMAVGMASVIMAVVANQIAGLSGSLVIGVLAATLLHTLNLLLVMLSPTIQSMRLQYVEFLSKFYEGGGRRYDPFKKR